MTSQGFILGFQEQLGGVEQTALVYRRASALTAANVLMGINGHQLARDATPDAVSAGLKDPPSWANFFGSAGGCACEHCRSWLSPAAYFVDLLLFLDKKHLAGQTRDPAGRSAEPPPRSGVPAAVLREHRDVAAVRRPGERGARDLRRDRRRTGRHGRARRDGRDLGAAPVPSPSTSPQRRTPRWRRRCTRRPCRSTDHSSWFAAISACSASPARN